MDLDAAKQLEIEARSVIAERGKADHLLEQIECGLRSTDEPGVIGVLLIAKALVLQIVGDPAELAKEVLTASSLLRESGEGGAAVFAECLGGVLLQRAGDLEAAADIAVRTLAAAERMPTNEEWGARTSHSLAVLFGELHAYGLAARSSTRSLAWEAARNDPQRRLTVEFVRGFYAVRAAETQPPDSSERAASVEMIDEARAAIEQLDGPAAALAANGLGVERQLLDGESVPPAHLDACRQLYDEVAPHWVAWHESLHGRVLNLAGQHAEAAVVLRRSLEKVWPVGEQPTRRELAHALSATGRTDEALEQLLLVVDDLDDFVRDQVARRAGDLTRRVESERHAAELRSRSERLVADLARDHLTGVASRRALEEHLDRPVDGRTEHAVFMCDLDHFKMVNDAFGHQVGDSVLARFGDLLNEHTRAEDLAGRLGGEEFVFVMRNDRQTAAAVAERLRRATETGPWADIADDLRVTVSIGVAVGTAPLRDLLRAADIAVYDAKHAGRNRVCIDSPEGRDEPDAGRPQFTSPR